MTDRLLAASFLPETAVLELTYRCNHSCLFCSCPWEDPVGSFIPKPELTKEQWKTAISKLCSMGVTNIAISGGDPLLRADLAEIIEYAASCQVEHIEATSDAFKSHSGQPNIYLLTNGRSVDDSIFQLCRDANVQLSMSLPGLETFAAHTGYDGADGVLSAFAKAKQTGLKTVANITVTKLNLYELDRTIATALLAGANHILLNRFLPGGRGLKYIKELSLTADELRTMLDIAEDTLKTAGRFGSLGTEVPLCLIDQSRFKHLQVSTRCAAAIEFFVVGPSGFVRVCNHSTVELNHVDDIEGLRTNQYWKIFTQKHYLPDSCNDCHERYMCDGGCREAAHILGGKVCSPDVLMCENSGKNDFKMQFF